MQNYPISLSTPSYLSRRRSYHSVQLRAWRKGIEDYINDRVKDSPEEVITYGDIEVALGINKEVIRHFLMPAGGGHNGITVYNPKLEKNKLPE